jgi:hypothetical protein
MRWWQRSSGRSWVRKVPELHGPIRQNRSMGLDIDFAFDVGEQENHRVAFHWGQLLGRVRITVDDMRVVEKNQAISLRSPRTKKFEFSVGQHEVHHVVIEKTRKRFLGGARKQDCRVLVDGEVVARHRPG